MNIFILPIEPVESRYTAEWFKHIPLQIKAAADSQGIAVKITTVEGIPVSDKVTGGAFLNFADTNVYKSSQLIALTNLIKAGEVKDGDKILVTDAWNPAVLQIKYMLDLLKIRAELHGIWHAGSYDSSDILGFTIPDKRWSNMTERALFYAFDKNYFASEYHIDVFTRELAIPSADLGRILEVGWPMEYLKALPEYRNDPSVKKEKIILFPHRLSSDKQPHIFIDLSVRLRDLGYEFVMTHERNLDKAAYHDLLRRAEFSISVSLHEMLGISMYEGVLHGVIPLVPARLSYKEMYSDDFKYPSGFSSSAADYSRNAGKLEAWIRTSIACKEGLQKRLEQEMKYLDYFFDGRYLYKSLLAPTLT